MEEKRKVDVIEVIGTTILISICVIFLIYLFTYISYLCVKKVNDAWDEIKAIIAKIFKWRV